MPSDIAAGGARCGDGNAVLRVDLPMSANTDYVVAMTDAVSSRAALVNVVWDLRDRAYDNPDPWDRVNAQAFFQAFAEALEAENERSGRPDGASWAEFGALLRAAADRAVGSVPPA
jgi:hypothetical protein